ncbi:hypothetical protein MRX96_029013 [Rhipicephalus microplus]
MLGISTTQLFELLADTFASAPTTSAALPVPALLPHARPELFAPFHFFPTPAIVEAIGEPCTADFSIRELRDALDSRGRHSAPGGDGITNHMLRNLDASLGHFHPRWGKALVIPVYKTGKLEFEPSSGSRRIGGMGSCILASGMGCSPDIALPFFNAVASTRVLYAVPLVVLRPAQ